MPRGSITDREARIARVLRPLGSASMSREQAKIAGQLLGMHWTSVYRLRKRFARDPVASSLIPRIGLSRPSRLTPAIEGVIEDVLQQWMLRERELAHPVQDLHTEIRRRCNQLQLQPPCRNTVSKRIAAYRQAQIELLGPQEAPGSFGAAKPLEIVQIDHTQADVFIVDRFTRRLIGRPWLSLAIDLATRCVVGFFLGMERPHAGTVALLISRIVLPKKDWLAHLELALDWPMHGIPKTLHLDNAAEFHGRALRLGCAEYGVELQYRPVGRPHFGGHIERLNRTLMQRLKGLPGATGNSPVGRKARKPEVTASLTLLEFEKWLALEIGDRYHRSEHRGLFGATPAGTWEVLAKETPVRRLAPGVEPAIRLLTHFMPMQPRIVQGDGVSIFYIRYWHSVFAVWREQRRKVRVRYHPEDLSRIYVSADGKNYVEARYADLRRPAISLWEQRAAVKALRAQSHPRLSEALVFKAIEQQREIVARARRETRRARTPESPTPQHLRRPDSAWLPAAPPAPSSKVDYSKTVDAFPVEIW